MRVAFRIEVSPQIGLGHLKRMSALAEAFGALGAECKFFTSEDEPIDYSGYDIVVTDSYLISDEYIDGLNEPKRIVVCYDDNALNAYSCDVVLNANLHAVHLSYRYGKKIPRMLLGGEFALLQKEFREADFITVHEDASRIFVLFGGSDVNSYTGSAVRAIRGIPGSIITVVFGPLSSGFEECKAENKGNDRIKVLHGPDSICDLIKDSDIAIVAAGSTVYELAALGVPTIIIPQVDNQVLAAEFLSRSKLMKSLGWWKNVAESEIAYEAESLLADYSRRISESKRLIKAVNKNGAEKTARRILEMWHEAV